MPLSLAEDRCQGRTARDALGQSSLVYECIDCLRRTDIPAEVNLTWMQPPKLQQYGWFTICPAKVDEAVSVYG